MDHWNSRRYLHRIDLWDITLLNLINRFRMSPYVSLSLCNCGQYFVLDLWMMGLNFDNYMTVAYKMKQKYYIQCANTFKIGQNFVTVEILLI